MKKLITIILFLFSMSSFAEVIQKKKLDETNIKTVDSQKTSFLFGTKYSNVKILKEKYVGMFSFSLGVRTAISQNEAILTSVDHSLVEMNKIDKRKEIINSGYSSKASALYLIRPNSSSSFVKTKIKTKNGLVMTSLNDGLNFGFGPSVFLMNSRKFDNNKIFFGGIARLGYEIYSYKKMNTELVAEYNYLLNKDNANSYVNLGINLVIF